MSYEGSRHICVDHQCVLSCNFRKWGRSGIRCTFLFPKVLEERERYSVGLVKEDGVLLKLIGCISEVDINLSCIHKRISDPCVIDYTSVLAAGHLVVDVACVHEIFLAEVVCRCHEGLVGGIFSLQHAVSAKPSEIQSDVHLRGNVLGGEYPYICLFLFLVCEQGTVISQFGMRSLCVILRKALYRIVPYPVWGIEDRVLFFLPLEPVIKLDRRAADSKP